MFPNISLLRLAYIPGDGLKKQRCPLLPGVLFRRASPLERPTDPHPEGFRPFAHRLHLFMLPRPCKWQRGSDRLR